MRLPAEHGAVELKAVAVDTAQQNRGIGRRLLAAVIEDLRKRGMACILLFMQGGPSQFETFSPKSGHANGGETKAISTSVSGIEVIGEAASGEEAVLKARSLEPDVVLIPQPSMRRWLQATRATVADANATNGGATASQAGRPSGSGASRMAPPASRI